MLSFFNTKKLTDQITKYTTKVNNFVNLYNSEKSIKDGKKQILDGASSIYSNNALILQQVQSQVQGWKASCLASLSQAKDALNAKLSAAYDIKTQLDAKLAIIENGWVQAESKINQLTGITARMKALADQYAAAVGSTA